MLQVFCCGSHVVIVIPSKSGDGLDEVLGMYCDGLFSGGIMQQLQFDHFLFDEAAMARIKVVQVRMPMFLG